MKIYNDLTQCIGNTPLIKVDNFSNYCKIGDLQNNIYVKAEFFNPSGSVKDRAAYNIISKAIDKGLIKENTTVIASTSGNMGISIAMICSLLNKKCIITMPSNFSKERILMMKAYNAEVVLTNAKKLMTGSVEKALELHKLIKDSYYIDQFAEENNYLAHYKTTGKEIYDDLDGKVDVVISTIGSGGTITGVAKYLKEKNPDIKIIGVEPSESPLITKGYCNAHNIQGIGASFIPKILDLNVIDEVLTASYEEAKSFCKVIMRDGLFVGISSGACLAATVLAIYKNKFKDKNIVVILPDNGSKYLSTMKKTGE